MRADKRALSRFLPSSLQLVLHRYRDEATAISFPAIDIGHHTNGQGDRHSLGARHGMTQDMIILAVWQAGAGVPRPSVATAPAGKRGISAARRMERFVRSWSMVRSLIPIRSKLGSGTLGRLAIIFTCRLALGCGVQSTSQDDEPTAAKAKGLPEAGFLAVGQLQNSDDSYCTCTRVAERACLTAGHCLFDFIEGKEEFPKEIVWLGNDGNMSMTPATGREVHPGYKCAWTSRGAPTEKLRAHDRFDLAVVYFGLPVPISAPIATIDYEVATIKPGVCAMNLIGWGIGGRAAVTTCIDGISNEFILGHHLQGKSCPGDSGSGLFDTRQLPNQVLTGVLSGRQENAETDADVCNKKKRFVAAAFNKEWLQCVVREGYETKPDINACYAKAGKVCT